MARRQQVIERLLREVSTARALQPAEASARWNFAKSFNTPRWKGDLVQRALKTEDVVPAQYHEREPALTREEWTRLVEFSDKLWQANGELGAHLEALAQTKLPKNERAKARAIKKLRKKALQAYVPVQALWTALVSYLNDLRKKKA